ncbi:MAG: PilZ domain-containing protein [Proteobacteria bacterium]|nr:PilZ domain-containing protein [Pseudomonadota bacterium]
MANTTGFIERRKHKRFKVKKGAYAILGSDQNKTGQIKDISRGGIAFEYSACSEQSSGTCDIGVYVSHGFFYLEKFSVIIVADFEVNDTISSRSSPKMQLSLQFGKLSLNQKVLLDYFLKEYTHK